MPISTAQETWQFISVEFDVGMSLRQQSYKVLLVCLVNIAATC